MKSIIVSCISALCFASSVLAADNAVFAEREAKIERAALRFEAEPLAEQVAAIDNDLAATPKDPALLYLRAFAYYAEATVARGQKDKQVSVTHLESAGKILEQIKDATWEAEAMALHGYVLNQLIGIKGGMSAMKLGPQSSALLGQAGEKAPNSPRVLFFRGESLVTTPEMWGGDVAQGIKLLEQASTAFESQPANAPLHWGHAESLAWLGIAKQKKGDLAGARAAWEQALAAEPAYGWVKYRLLPSLDKVSGKN